MSEALEMVRRRVTDSGQLRKRDAYLSVLRYINYVK